MNHVTELMGIAKEMGQFNEKIAGEIWDMAKEVNTISKRASLINQGDRVICLNPVQGIYKGRIYVAGEYVKPNYLAILEDDGTKVGIFRADRFNIDWKAY